MRVLLESIPNHVILLIGFTALVMLASLVEIVPEFRSGESLMDMLDDLLLFFTSIGILLMFTLDYLHQQKSLRQLQSQMNAMSGKLESFDASSRNLTKQYRSVIQRQFTSWQLTPSEQEISLALIKGLSFREVAELRNTREKTVRQQAATVYKKAGLSGRHELAGWFFEDLLDPMSNPAAEEDS